MGVGVGVGVRGLGSEPVYGLFAANPPGECVVLWGGGERNGLQYGEQVRYVLGGRLVGSVRTVLPEPVPAPAPAMRRVEDFGQVLVGFRNYRIGRVSRDEMRERVGDRVGRRRGRRHPEELSGLLCRLF